MTFSTSKLVIFIRWTLIYRSCFHYSLTSADMPVAVTVTTTMKTLLCHPLRNRWRKPTSLRHLLFAMASGTSALAATRISLPLASTTSTAVVNDPTGYNKWILKLAMSTFNSFFTFQCSEECLLKIKFQDFHLFCFFGAANGVSVYVAYHKLQALVPVCVCVRMSVFPWDRTNQVTVGRDRRQE